VKRAIGRLIAVVLLLTVVIPAATPASSQAAAMTLAEGQTVTGDFKGNGRSQIASLYDPQDDLGLRIVVVAHPAEEVLGIARERAHAAGRHVEQVPLVSGGVRRTPAGRGCRVDQGHPVARGQAGQQVRGSQGSRGTGPDHHDATVAFASAHGHHLQSLVTMLTKLPNNGANTSTLAGGSCSRPARVGQR